VLSAAVPTSHSAQLACRHRTHGSATKISSVTTQQPGKSSADISVLYDSQQVMYAYAKDNPTTYSNASSTHAEIPKICKCLFMEVTQKYAYPVI
jgi:hypothetical protein